MDDDLLRWPVLSACLIAAVVGIVNGLVWLIGFLARLVAHYWPAIVISLAIAVISPWLVRLLITLLMPPVRRLGIRLHYLILDTAVWWSGKTFERRVNRVFKEAKRRAHDITAQHIR